MRNVFLLVGGLASLLIGLPTTAIAQRAAPGISGGYGDPLHYGRSYNPGVYQPNDLDYGLGPYYYNPYLNAGTAGGSYLRGQAAVISAMGRYNQNTAQALDIYQDAVREAVANEVAATKAYFNKQEMWEDYNRSQNPAPSKEQIEKYNDFNTPDRLDPEAWNDRDRTFNWPAALMVPSLRDDRQRLEELFAQRNDRNTGRGTPLQARIDELSDRMIGFIKANIDEIHPEDYIAARSFLESVGYEARFAPRRAESERRDRDREEN